MEQKIEVHVARQPIFDVSLNVFGYELLFRNNVTHSYDGLDGDQATYDVIANSFLVIGIETLTNGKKAFINFTTNSLKNSVPAMLPRELVAVEVLEDVIPDEEIINACKNLKKKGYLLVLDDFVFKPEYMPLIELTDIIKVDFRMTPRKERQEMIQRLSDYSIKFLAEKVETQEEFQDALEMGYSYFQGYFFCKPSILSSKSLPGYKTNYFHILQEINQPEIEFKQIEAIIRRDVSLSYQLLKFINSSVFGLKRTISSLQQALVLLGQKELMKWISLIALKNIANDKPGELILQSLIRARFAEKLAISKMLKQQAPDAFLMGMLSHIDVLLDRPLHEVLDEISLTEEIKNALLETEHNLFSLLYKLIQSYERGDWKAYSGYVAEMGIDEREVMESYRESLVWAHELVVCNY